MVMMDRYFALKAFKVKCGISFPLKLGFLDVSDVLATRRCNFPFVEAPIQIAMPGLSDG
jgi:hypothetical protein